MFLQIVYRIFAGIVWVCFVMLLVLHVVFKGLVPGSPKSRMFIGVVCGLLRDFYSVLIHSDRLLFK